MSLSTLSLVISIVGLLGSFFLVGLIPSLFALGLNIYLIIRDRSIETVRALAISVVGVLLPVVMYLNTFGFALYDTPRPFQKILRENYASLGIELPFGGKDPGDAGSSFASEEASSEEDAADTADMAASEDEIVMYENGKAVEDEAQEPAAEEKAEETEPPEIFESLKSIDSNKEEDGTQVAPSDDDMPSYGGLPVGTMLVGQYFREDDHNCNPVLVLRNQTGKPCRYECRFTARDEEGNELAYSEKTVEVVRDGSLFIFEGRFDKRELSGGIPAGYEFIVSKRDPYEKDVSDDVTVYTRIKDSHAFLTADNPTDMKVKIDAYVLFFDGSELVDCMWMIPQNTDEVCLEPGTMASIRGDSYYRFDRVETYYTAYEAVEGQ